MNMWLVGAGYWGSKLLDNLKKFDVSAQVIDIRNGQTIADITDQSPVMLATPLWQHHEQTCELLRKGHDVYVEKPMAETLAQVNEIHSCIGANQLLMVGHLFVHHPQMAFIQQLMADGAIGQLTHINSQRLNWGIYQTKTDPLLSLATHDISIVQTLAGTVTGINQAHSWNFSNNVQPDRVWFSGVCDQVTFDIDVSWHWPVRTRQTIIIGTQGQIIWDQDANTVTVSKNLIENNRAMADTRPEVFSYNYEVSPLEAELKHWVDCIKTQTQPKTNIESASAVAKVIDQVKKLI